MKKTKRTLVLISLFISLFFYHLVFAQKINAQLPTMGLPELPQAYDCGQTYTDRNGVFNFCNCANKDAIGSRSVGGSLEFDWCCGWYYEGACQSIAPEPTSYFPPVDSAVLDNFNPLKLFSSRANQLSTPGGIISEILRFAFPIAGIILFVMLIMAGLKMLTGATNSKNMEEGKQMISTAILGFIILFAAYWIAQLLQIIFGIIIL